MSKVVRVLHSVAAMNMGGIENFVMNLYRTVDRSKVQFDFLYAVDEDCFFDSEILSLGGRIFKIQSPNKHPFAAMKFYNRIFKDNPEIKVLHEHSSGLTGSLATFKSAKAAGITKRAIHSHSSATPLAGGLKGAVMRRNLDKNVTRIESLATDFFACSDKASEWMFPNATRHGIVTHIIKNGIDVNRFKFNEEERVRIREELGIAPDTFVIGNVARLANVKNQTFLVRILKSLIEKIDAALLLVGEGPLRNSIEEEANRLGISDRVHLVGNQTDSAPFYSAMDLLCMPSLYEGLPFSCVEAQCNGLPLLLSDTISRDASFSERVVFQNLDNSLNDWSNQAILLKTSLSDRASGSALTARAGFDINETAEFLQDYYLS